MELMILESGTIIYLITLCINYSSMFLQKCMYKPMVVSFVIAFPLIIILEIKLSNFITQLADYLLQESTTVKFVSAVYNKQSPKHS